MVGRTIPLPPSWKEGGRLLEVWRDTLQTSWQWDCVPLHSRFGDGGGVRIRAGEHPQTPGSGTASLCTPALRMAGEYD